MLNSTEYDISTEQISDRYNQVPHLAQNTIRESDKSINKQNKQESQKVRLFPAGDHKASRNRQDIITNFSTVPLGHRAQEYLMVLTYGIGNPLREGYP